VDLKDVLGNVETDCGDLHRSGSLSGAEAIPLFHRALPGAGAVHPIIYGTGALDVQSFPGSGLMPWENS
jgi:hypothetical protein